MTNLNCFPFSGPFEARAAPLAWKRLCRPTEPPLQLAPASGFRSNGLLRRTISGAHFDFLVSARLATHAWNRLYRPFARFMSVNRRANHDLLESLGLEAKQFPKDNVGTIHTVQGRDAETVIFMLDAPSDAKSGARQWAGRTVNLLNVAVSRTKRQLYVVGSRKAWKDAGVFWILGDKNRMPVASLGPDASS